MMFRLTRALVVAATVAMILAVLVVAQASSVNQDTPSQQELAQRWNGYYHSTRMAPAQLETRVEAQGRSDNPTRSPAPLAAPSRQTEATGEVRALVISLAALAALVGVGGLAGLAARRAGRGPRVDRGPRTDRPRVDRGPRVGQPA
jgi:hypothetical protein